MPTYEYKCDACGHAFERFHSIMSPPIKKCPECGKNKVKRLLGVGAGLIFKGSGFYITDYRSDSYKDAAKSDSGAAPAEGGDKKSDTAATTDAKPATEAKPAAKSGTVDQPAPKPATKPTESSPKSKKSDQR